MKIFNVTKNKVIRAMLCKHKSEFEKNGYFLMFYYKTSKKLYKLYPQPKKVKITI